MRSTLSWWMKSDDLQSKTLAMYNTAHNQKTARTTLQGTFWQALVTLTTVCAQIMCFESTVIRKNCDSICYFLSGCHSHIFIDSDWPASPSGKISIAPLKHPLLNLTEQKKRNTFLLNSCCKYCPCRHALHGSLWPKQTNLSVWKQKNGDVTTM